MSLRALLSIGLLLACALFAPRAAAQTYCQFTGTAPGFAFGTVAGNPTVQNDTASNVNLQCYSYDGAVTVKVCLKLSNGSPDTALLPQRRMANAAYRLNWQGYRDAARSLPWGDGTTAAALETTFQLNQTVWGINYRNITLPVYGRVPGGQAGIASGDFRSDLTLNMSGSLNTSASCSSLTQTVDTVAVVASATVPAACTLATNPLSFGTVNVLTANVDTTTSLGLNCTLGAPWTIRMNGGTVANSVSARRMGPGGVAPGVINYQLRHGSANGALWGDGTSGTTVLTGTGSGSSQTVTVYGRIPGGQQPPPVGTYSDVVTVSVEY